MTLAELLEKLMYILSLPCEIFNRASDALDEVSFSTFEVGKYLSYMHYAMGDTLWFLFSSMSLIAIATGLWFLIVKVFAWFMEILPIP